MVVAVAAGTAGAQSIDPARVHHVRIAPGEVRGARGDLRRTGRASGLPERPTVGWRRALGGPLEAPPVASADGRIAVVLGGAGAIRLLSAGGDELGEVALGVAPASVAPAFLADGTLVALTTSGELAFVGRDLAVRRRIALPVRAVDALPLAPTPSGGVVVAAGRVVVELDGEGRVVATTTLDDVVAGPPAVAPVAGAGGHETLLPTSRGDLVALHPPFAARRLTGLGGNTPGGVVVADDGAVWASVADAVVRVERRAGAVPWRATAASGLAPSNRPPALGADGSIAFVAVDGSLVVLAATGEVRHRVALDRVPGPAIGAAPTASRPIVHDDGPPILVDAEGRVAFVRPTGRVGVVSGTGLVAIASERVCAMPIGVAATGPGQFVVGCGEGALVAVVEGSAAE